MCTGTHSSTPTPREFEVLKLRVKGLGVGAVATRLNISESAVNQHLNSLYGKLGVSSLFAAVRAAFIRNLIGHCNDCPMAQDAEE